MTGRSRRSPRGGNIGGMGDQSLATLTPFLCESRQSPDMSFHQLQAGWRALEGLWRACGGASLGVTRRVRLGSGDCRYDIIGISPIQDSQELVAHRCLRFRAKVQEACGG